MSRERKLKREQSEKSLDLAAKIMGNFAETHDRLLFEEAEEPEELGWPAIKAVAGFLLLAFIGVALFGMATFLFGNFCDIES